METSGLRIGVSVDIQRSDGRVHSAVVSSVDHDRKCVTVEWFERGETKGKEIDYDQIFKLNPDLQTPPANSAPAKPVTAPQVEETRERRSQAANTPKETKDPNEKHQQSFAVQPSRLPSSRPSMLPGASKSGIPTPSLNNIARPASSHGQPPVNGSNANGDHTPVANGNIEEGHLQAAALNAAAAVNSAANSHFAIPQAPAPRAAAATAATAAAAADETPAEERAAPVVAPRAAGGAKAERIREREREREQRERERELREAEAKDAKNKRQSTTLAAIQRIAEKREERRAHARNKHDCPEYDPSNPNWEFIRMIREFVDTLNYNPLTLNDSVEQRQITVCVRKRPINKKELAARAIDVVTVPAKDIIYVHEPKSKVDLTKYLDNQTFRFDYAFNEDADNELVYKFTAQPLVESIFERGMATCFAYGQTGSGKTHTMGGNFESGTRGQQDSSRGVYLMAARDVFKLLNSRYKKEGLSVGATFFEIYSGKVFDLLNNKHRLKILEDGKAVVQVVGLKEEPVASVEEVYKLIQAGNACRTSGQTSANNYSSRSHAVFQIVLRKAATRKLHGKFSLIDLAGNERGADTMSSDRSTRMESAEINKSLLALKECIRALGRRGAHLPFRASKLTLVLRDSFVGENSRTCMIAMISPGNNCVEHTLNTLRYADRVKELDSSSGGDAGAGGQQPSDAPPPRRYSDEHVDLMAENAADSEGEDDEILSLNSSVSSSHDDLGLIKTANQGEVPDEMFNLQDVVEHINELEEGIVEDYRDLLDDMPEWTNAQHDILKMADDVECDAELLASRLEQQVDAQLKRFQAMKEKLERFKQTLRQEEILSKNLSQKRTEPAPPPASQAHAPVANKPTARR